MVSVLTTVYNSGKYLSACIESVLHSTYKDWEFIIVDDNSTDDSVKIAKEFAKKDERIKVYQNKINLGDYPNRNKAASLASGKYIKFLDADDMLYPQSLDIMVKAMEEFPEAAMGISEYVEDDYDPYPFQLTPKETYYREYLQRGILGVGPTATIIQRKIFEQSKGFTGQRYIGDVELWLKISSQFPIVKMQAGLIFWRRHAGQEFDLGNTTNAYLIMNYQMNLAALTNNNCPLQETDRQIAIREIKYRQGRNLLNLAFKKRKPLSALRILKKSQMSINNLLSCLLPQNINS